MDDDIQLVGQERPAWARMPRVEQNNPDLARGQVEPLRPFSSGDERAMPDVSALQREIAELREQLGEARDAIARLEDEDPQPAISGGGGSSLARLERIEINGKKFSIVGFAGPWVEITFSGEGAVLDWPDEPVRDDNGRFPPGKTYREIATTPGPVFNLDTFG